MGKAPVRKGRKNGSLYAVRMAVSHPLTRIPVTDIAEVVRN